MTIKEVWHEILLDSQRYARQQHRQLCFKTYLYVFFMDAAFCRLVGYRMRLCHNVFIRIIGRLIIFMTRYLNLYIVTPSLGKSLYIMHGFSTIINAKRIGDRCLICQQVTIGWSPSGEPTIGDDVYIFAGAKVIGGITIGNDVWIGANTVVNSDIPDHCMVVGMPGKVVKRRNSVDEEWHKI